jgi:diguanylate cyclase (GGDEF)-like protein
MTSPNRNQRNLEIVRQTAEILSSASGLSETFERFCLLLAKFMEASVVLIAVKRDDGTYFDFVYDHGESSHPHRRIDPQSQTQRVIDSGMPIHIRSLQEMRGPIVPIKDLRLDDSQSAMFVPLRFGTETIGALSVQTNEASAYSADDLQLLETCALYVAIAVQAETMRGEKEVLQSVASRDALTGVASRRAFDQRLREDWTKAQREDGVLSVIVMDVDWFKRFNDTYGHVAGDACLNHVAQAAQSCIVRESDLLARYGGEEFTAILWQTDGVGARVVAERILHAIRALEIPHAESPLGRVTTSIGVAAAKALSIADPQALVKAADRALYAAKTGGRDRIHSDESGESAATFTHPETRTNIRSQSSTLVGRVGDIAALAEATKQSRVLTLVGRSGIGKTRVALAAANRRLYTFRDGAWVIDCSLMTDGSMLESVILATLRIPQDQDRTPRDTLVSALANKNLLLIFDDCESVASDVSNLSSAIAAAADGVVLLATSERPLATSGEEVFELREPSLADATALFIDRAQAADKRFQPTEKERQTIERICEKLENIPLAIELAAARVRTMPVENILATLERESTLTSILSAVAWSYELLGEKARQLFERLSIFPSLFRVEAARDICSGGELEPWDVIDALDELTLANLVKRFESGEALRYALADHARAFGRELLRERSERTAIQSRYIRYFRAFVRRVSVRIENGGADAAVDDIRAEYENIEGALQYALNRRVDVSTGVDIALALRKFWLRTGRLREGRHWTDVALASGLPQGARLAELLDVAASIAHCGGDVERLADLSEQLVAYHEASGGARSLAKSLNSLATARSRLGDAESANRLYQRALKHYRDANDDVGAAIVLSNLGSLTAQSLHDLQGAGKLFNEGLKLFREQGRWAQTGAVLSDLAALSIVQGQYQQAALHGNEALAIADRVGSDSQAATALLQIARARLLLGESELARESLAAARERIRKAPTIRNTIGVFEVGFLFACDFGASEAAAAFLGFVEGLRAKHRLPRSSMSLGEVKQRERELRLKLGSAFEAHVQRGRSSSLAESEKQLEVVMARIDHAVTTGEAASQ